MSPTENLFERKVGIDRHFARQVSQKTIACHQIAVYDLKRLGILGFTLRMRLPADVPCPDTRSSRRHIAHATEIIATYFRIHILRQLHKRCIPCIIDHKHKRSPGCTPHIHTPDSFRHRTKFKTFIHHSPHSFTRCKDSGSPSRVLPSSHLFYPVTGKSEYAL